ncbi:hypothetical protein GW17_00062375 [Ensete ventricosum]|uniref:Uncharacterized protein n=1 Tax=Ensete ventricosum TaxID=4639 RepID=A0A444BTD0_ENSVE|nr:hypothetical protein B296_00021397 [Ensete ventricosum]RWV76887.1 hypothetical protein GW17_00062375 [Ensete ventricosum]
MASCRLLLLDGVTPLDLKWLVRLRMSAPSFGISISWYRSGCWCCPSGSRSISMARDVDVILWDLDWLVRDKSLAGFAGDTPLLATGFRWDLSTIVFRHQDSISHMACRPVGHMASSLV